MKTVFVPFPKVSVPFGDAVVSTVDTVLGCETCEELFTGNRYLTPSHLMTSHLMTSHLPQSPHCHGAGWG